MYTSKIIDCFGRDIFDGSLHCGLTRDIIPRGISDYQWDMYRIHHEDTFTLVHDHFTESLDTIANRVHKSIFGNTR